MTNLDRNMYHTGNKTLLLNKITVVESDGVLKLLTRGNTTRCHTLIITLSSQIQMLRAGRSGDRIPVRARFSTAVQIGPGAQPSPLYNGYRLILGGKATTAWR